MRGGCNARVGLLCLTALTLLSLGYAGESQEDEPPVPKTTEELKEAIAKVLQETRVLQVTQTPGAGVVLVSKDHVRRAVGIGLADRAGRRGLARAFEAPTELAVLTLPRPARLAIR